MNFLLIFIMASMAFSISVIAGGGAGLLLIPLLSLLLEPILVPVTLTVGSTASSLARIVAFHNYIQWSLVKPIVTMAIPGVLVAGYLLFQLDPVYVEFFMSLFLISHVVLLFRSEVRPEEAEPLTPNQIKAVGFLIGFISTLTGAVGVLFNRVYFRYGLDNQSVMATRAASEVAVHILKLCLYSALGLLSETTIGIGSAIGLAAVLVILAVKSHLHLLPREFSIKVAYLVMAGSGMLMLQHTTMDIIDQHNPQLFTVSSNTGGDLKLGWNDTYYTLELNLTKGLEFEKTVPLEALPEKHQQVALSQCAQGERLYLEAVYRTRLEEYEVHCYDQANQLTRKTLLVNT